MRVAIIGAGLAGLAAARALHRAGLVPAVFDKGRGVGGRLATRRAEGGLRFDHGAQYLPATDAGFVDFLQEAVRAGAAGTWSPDGGAPKIVGRPGMSGIAKFLADGLDIRQRVEIDRLRREDGGWQVAGARFDRVICTVPAPQAARLIADKPALRDALATVVMEPNLTLMLALPARENAFETRLDPEDDIAWLALNSGKADSTGSDCWVAQAGLQWSRDHLEHDKDDIARAMLPLVCDRLGVAAADAIHVAAHRWRYAQASHPLGQPFLNSSDGLFIGGDWGLSNRAEGAWLSGRAMAEAVLATG